ncbi:MAG TPA: diacylglycerol kinase family protein [Burkholderiales bacterium]|nr:diacylglycerol kinase family protein [Burkholderiales bacterium]
MRVTLIHNPGAGRQGEDNGAQLRAFLAEHGYEVRYQSAKEDDWKAALKKPADMVVVAGGDGTVAKVTRRMVGRGLPVGVLPSGTANNIARTLGLLERPFEELVRGWKNGRRVKLDVGVAAGPWGERYFVEGVGAGLFANLLTKPAGDRVKKRKGAVENALQRLQSLAEIVEPVDVRATLDGEDISGHYLMIEAVNLRYVGPNLHLAHDSQPGDGQFDVVLATEAQRDRLVHYLGHWQDNRERLAMLPTRRGRHLKLEWTGFPLHIDDKLRPTEKVKPEEIAGLVEVRLDGDSVEFLAPA